MIGSGVGWHALQARASQWLDRRRLGVSRQLSPQPRRGVDGRGTRALTQGGALSVPSGDWSRFAARQPRSGLAEGGW